MRAHTQQFNKSLTHALVMDIIWGTTDVHIIFPFTVDWGLVMLSSIQFQSQKQRIYILM